MEENFIDAPRPISDFSEAAKIDKKSYLPAYAQLARILKQHISNGAYQPGSQLPSEASIAKSFGISAMTARQAIKILEEEGLVNRIQGYGTFVKRLEFTASNFGLDSLRNVFMEKEKLKVQIIKATVEPANKYLENILRLGADSSVIVVERLILYEKNPIIFHISYARAAPESPFVENMLNTDVLTGLFLEKGSANIKKAELQLLPTSLDQRKAAYMHLKEGENVFKLEHIYYDFSDLPSAFGFFLIAPDKMPLICRMGVWND